MDRDLRRNRTRHSIFLALYPVRMHCRKQKRTRKNRCFQAGSDPFNVVRTVFRCDSRSTLSAELHSLHGIQHTHPKLRRLSECCLAGAGKHAQLSQHARTRYGPSFLFSVVGMADHRKTDVLCHRTIHSQRGLSSSQHFQLRQSCSVVGSSGFCSGSALSLGP